MTRSPFSCSLVFTETDGLNMGNGVYSGGIGLLQKGEVDLVSQVIPYPLDGPNISYALPSLEDETCIGSFYNISTTRNSVDVINMLNTFSLVQWLYVALTLGTCYLVLKIGLRKVIGVKDTDAAWTVITFFMDQENFHAVNLFLQIMAAMMSFFTFFVLTYLTSSMNTDLASVEDPRGLTNLDDILECGVQPFWGAGIPAIDYFRTAEEGTIESKIWKHALKGRWEVAANAENFVELFPDMLSQKTAMMGRNADLSLGGLMICSIIRDPEHFSYHPEIYGLIACDPRVKTHLSGTIYSSYTEEGLKRKIMKRVTGYNEFGMPIPMLDRYIWSEIKWTAEVDLCVTRSIIKERPVLLNIKLESTKQLFKWFFVGLGVASLVLFCERVAHDYLRIPIRDNRVFVMVDRSQCQEIKRPKVRLEVVLEGVEGPEVSHSIAPSNKSHETPQIEIKNQSV